MRTTAPLTERAQRILGPIDPSVSRGLEIGALDKPLVRRDEGQTWYADFTDTESLRTHYQVHDEVDPGGIVDVDFVLGSSPLSELARDVGPFDYVVASHVVEHLPDLVGWLDEVSSVLAPGGMLCLAVPDRRFCFDRLRADAELADVIAAHLARDSRASTRAFFDFASHFVPVEAADAWRGTPGLRPKHDIREVYGWVKSYSAAPAESANVHVWAFTPSRLAEVMDALADLELTDLRIVHLEPTARSGHEFFVRLAKGAVDSPRRWGPVGQEQEEEEEDDALSVLQRRLVDLEVERDRLSAQVGELRTSTSWRATAPLRAVSSFLGRTRRPRRGSL